MHTKAPLACERFSRQAGKLVTNVLKFFRYHTKINAQERLTQGHYTICFSDSSGTDAWYLHYANKGLALQGWVSYQLHASPVVCPI